MLIMHWQRKIGTGYYIWAIFAYKLNVHPKLKSVWWLECIWSHAEIAIYFSSLPGVQHFSLNLTAMRYWWFLLSVEKIYCAYASEDWIEQKEENHTKLTCSNQLLVKVATLQEDFLSFFHIEQLHQKKSGWRELALPLNRNIL